MLTVKNIYPESESLKGPCQAFFVSCLVAWLYGKSWETYVERYVSLQLL